METVIPPRRYRAANPHGTGWFYRCKSIARSQGSPDEIVHYQIDREQIVEIEPTDVAVDLGDVTDASAASGTTAGR